MEDTFKTIASPPVQPQDDSQNWQNGDISRSGLDPVYCLRKAQMVFGCYRRDEANNPEIFSAAIAAVFEGYSREVVERAADPRTGIASQYKFLPAVQEVREFCDRESQRQHRMSQEPIRRSSPLTEWKWVAPLGCKYAGMVAKHGRPIGAFEVGGYLGPSSA
jgi:hypothetical protein